MPNRPDNRSSGKSTGAKSAKAIKAASKKNPGAGKKMAGSREIPWLTIGAVVAVLALIGVLAYNLVPKYQEQAEAEKYTPSESNQDPSSDIDGVVKIDYPAALHVNANQRVAYDQSPPFGGPHDAVWATCTGVVYPEAIRTENAVHALEHGAIWITYNPDKVSSADIDALAAKVDGEPYSLMSPYPGLDTAVSVQSWGHQLKVDSADDKRIGHFIAAMRQNKYAYPEVGASCSTIPGSFDPASPPPFDPTAPGPDAVPMSGEGLAQDPSEMPGSLPGGLPPGLGDLPSDLGGVPAQPTP
ncbi:DUF3105 domain-containing protein [Aldersonia kunmingensis]|uniref:DUF3105 domain-containing protein n=1 Tax=Aldersonia kunmingensis TaxID=408066 RepID=UPI00082C3FC6|nr:DUF3105 domain-containing protein [Aldersonia kunmingensis]